MSDPFEVASVYIDQLQQAQVPIQRKFQADLTAAYDSKGLTLDNLRHQAAREVEYAKLAHEVIKLLPRMVAHYDDDDRNAYGAFETEDRTLPQRVHAVTVWDMHQPYYVIGRHDVQAKRHRWRVAGLLLMTPEPTETYDIGHQPHWYYHLQPGNVQRAYRRAHNEIVYRSEFDGTGDDSLEPAVANMDKVVNLKPLYDKDRNLVVLNAKHIASHVQVEYETDMTRITEREVVDYNLLGHLGGLAAYFGVGERCKELLGVYKDKIVAIGRSQIGANS